MVVAAGYLGALIGARKSSTSGLLHSITLADTSGGGSTGFFRLGLAFTKGDVPSGSRLKVQLPDGTPVRAALLEPSRWSDGSLRHCVLAGEVVGGVIGQVTLQVSAQAGSQPTSGLDPWAYLAANSDLRVEISAHSGSQSGALPDRSYRLNAAAAVTTRRRLQADTAVCLRLFAWGHPSGEKHLMCLHYVDLWLAASGAVAAIEWTPVLSQHWWIDNPFGDGAQPKELRSYAASVRDGAATLASYAGLEHAYYCQWAALRTADDDQHAKRLWLSKGTAMPTLAVTYSLASKQRMMRAGYLPPLDQATSYNVTYGAAYEPLGLNNHRAAINGTGGYPGRGLITNMDSVALVNQTPANWRVARVSAQATLSVHHHIKDHRAAGGDISLGLMPLPITRLGAQSYPGLAAETIAVTGTGATLPDVAPVGGSGAFSNWDDAHHTVYAYFMAFIEGERYLADAVLDQYGYFLQAANWDGFGRNPPHVWGLDAPRRDLTGIPYTSQFFGAIGLGHRQERSYCWTQLSWDHAYALLPDGDRHLPYLRNLMDNASTWLAQSAGFFPASNLAFGGWWFRNPPALNVWMQSLTSLAFMRHQLLTENGHAGHGTVIGLINQMLVNLFDHHPYALHEAVHAVTTDDTVALAFLPPNEIFVQHQPDIVNSVLTLSNNKRLLPQNGDQVLFTQLLDQVPPPQVVVGQRYYVVQQAQVNATTATFRIAATPGGAPLTLGDVANCRTLFKMAAYSQFSVIGAGGSPIPADDEFMFMAQAACEYAYGSGRSELPLTKIQSIRAFTSPKTFSNFANWNFDGDIIRS